MWCVPVKMARDDEFDPDEPVLTVRVAENGYVLQQPGNKPVVVESGEHASTTAACVLREIQEMLGLLGSDHDKTRCFVVVKLQDGKEIDV